MYQFETLIHPAANHSMDIAHVKVEILQSDQRIVERQQ